MSHENTDIMMYPSLNLMFKQNTQIKKWTALSTK